jgi:hypothetical protein
MEAQGEDATGFKEKLDSLDAPAAGQPALAEAAGPSGLPTRTADGKVRVSMGPGGADIDGLMRHVRKTLNKDEDPATGQEE